MRRDPKPLPRQVEDDLLSLIRAARPEERFPSEVELAERFGVSRVTVRSALAALERKGFVVRRQGLGTFVNHNALQIQTRIDESIEFGRLIQASGHSATLARAQVAVERAGSGIAQRLCLAGEASLAIVFRKVFAAVGVPVMSVLNAVPLDLLPGGEREQSHAELLSGEPIYTFLAERCGQQVTHQIAEVRSVAAPPAVARELAQAPGAPVLNLEEVGYAGDRPVFYSDEYYNTQVIKFHMVRRPG